MTDRNSRFEPAGRSALVTGGAQGLGFGIAGRLLAWGVDVTIFDKDGEALAAAVEALAGAGAGRLASVQGDVRSSADIRAAFDAAASAHGEVDLLVNNAGWANIVPLVELEEDDWDAVLGVCLTGTFLCTRELARREGSGGAVVNMSSQNAQSATTGLAHYCAAKAAIEQFTRVAALELAGRGTRVNAVAPGFIRTPLSEQGFASGPMADAFLARTPLGRFGEVDDVAEAVALLCSTATRWVTGAVLPVDGGAHIRGLHDYLAVTGGCARQP